MQIFTFFFYLTGNANKSLIIDLEDHGDVVVPEGAVGPSSHSGPTHLARQMTLEHKFKPCINVWWAPLPTLAPLSNLLSSTTGFGEVSGGTGCWLTIQANGDGTGRSSILSGNMSTANI